MLNPKAKTIVKTIKKKKKKTQTQNEIVSCFGGKWSTTEPVWKEVV